MTDSYRVLTVAMLALCMAWAGAPAFAQQAEPPEKKAESKPAAEGEDLSAVVVEVKGMVQRAEVSPKDADNDAVAKTKWTAVKKGDTLPAGTQIRTGLRAHVVLRFGDASVVKVKRSTLASIDQFRRDANTETVRLGLGYGAVRGGTSEGTVRSDFVVESTVATLAKRGTEGWEFWVEPHTGRFRVSLAESGLVEALARLTGQRRMVRPGEYADWTNIGVMWVNQDIFDRTVHFFTAESVTGADLDFMVRNPHGIAVTGPGLGSEAAGFAGRAAGQLQDATPLRRDRRDLFDTLLLRPSIAVRPEGNFGVAPTFDVQLPERNRKAYQRSAASHRSIQREVSRQIEAQRRR